MSAVVKQDDLPEKPQGATLLAVISRAASDPNVDIEKMERLMAMHERMEAKRAEAEFSQALSEMQLRLPSSRARRSRWHQSPMIPRLNIGSGWNTRPTPQIESVRPRLFSMTT